MARMKSIYFIGTGRMTRLFSLERVVNSPSHMKRVLGDVVWFGEVVRCFPRDGGLASFSSSHIHACTIHCNEMDSWNP